MLRRSKPLSRKKGLKPGKGFSGKKPLARNAAPEGDTERGESPLTAKAHALLWALLQDRDNLGGRNFTFAEYARLGPMVVDFVCPAARLAISLDVESESASAKAWFEKEGYRFITFVPETVLRDPKAAMAVIAESFTLRLV